MRSGFHLHLSKSVSVDWCDDQVHLGEVLLSWTSCIVNVHFHAWATIIFQQFEVRIIVSLVRTLKLGHEFCGSRVSHSLLFGAWVWVGFSVRGGGTRWCERACDASEEASRTLCSRYGVGSARRDSSVRSDCCFQDAYFRRTRAQFGRVPRRSEHCFLTDRRRE